VWQQEKMLRERVNIHHQLNLLDDNETYVNLVVKREGLIDKICWWKVCMTWILYNKMSGWDKVGTSINKREFFVPIQAITVKKKNQVCSLW